MSQIVAELVAAVRYLMPRAHRNLVTQEEILKIDQTLANAAMKQETPRLVVLLEGGLVQWAGFEEGKATTPLDLVVIDADVQGSDPSELYNELAMHDEGVSVLQFDDEITQALKQYDAGEPDGCPGCTGENEPDEYERRDNADTPGGLACPVCGNLPDDPSQEQQDADNAEGFEAVAEGFPRY